MSLKKIHLQRVVELINKECQEDLFKCFSLFIYKKLIEEKRPILETEAKGKVNGQEQIQEVVG